MKAEIHPKYYPDAKVRCACGVTHTVGSTKESYSIDICSACHPFYTGKQKLVDTAGRVDKFMARQRAAAVHQAERRAIEKKRAAHKAETLEEKITRKAHENEEAKVVAKPVVTTKPGVVKKPAKKAAAKKAAPAKKPAKKPATKAKKR